jgi:hypothetical protein
MKISLKKIRALTRATAAVVQIVLCLEVLYLVIYAKPDLAWHWSYLAILPLAVVVFWPVGRGHYKRYG